MTRVERVVVTLDAVSDSRAAIETAVRLAARWRARLHAVFLEDDDLLRLAQLPFARQVSLGAGVEALTLTQAERQLRAFAEEARRDLAAAARRQGVTWSFAVARGETTGTAGDASPADLLVAGVAARPIGRHFRVEYRWWSRVAASASSFLLASHNWEGQGTVAALLHSADDTAERLLLAAAQHAESGGGRIVVICPKELSESPGFGGWLGERLERHAIAAELDIAPDDPTALVRHIGEGSYRLVAIAADDPHAQRDSLRRFVAGLGCDVLVVR